MPRVSVIIPTYNRAGFVQEAIRSVQAQTHPDVEIIVVDDASADDTVARVGAMALQDARITLIPLTTNGGANIARNTGMRHARGEFINFLDSDDLFAPDKLEKQLAVFEQNPDLDMVVCQCALFHDRPGDSDQVWHRLDSHLSDYRDVLTAMLHGEVNWGSLSPLYRRSFLDRIGPWAEDLIASDEREFHLRAVTQAPRLTILPDVLAYARARHASARQEGSKGALHNNPPQLRSRLKARRYIWHNVRRAGLDTRQNRLGLLPALVVIARQMADRRMVDTFAAWMFALRVAPGMAWRAKLIGIVLPAITLVFVTDRSGHRLRRLFMRFGLEREHYNS